MLLSRDRRRRSPLRRRALAVAFAAVWPVAAVQGAPQDAPAPVALAERLAVAVDLPTPAKRRAAADELAKTAGVGLEAWLAACARLRPAVSAEAGVRTQSVPLVVGDVVEATEIVTVVPPGLDLSKPAPLLLALHGAGGRGEDVASLWRSPAAAAGAVIVAPTEAGANDGYRFTRRERLAALAVLRWARRTFDVDENRIFVVGVSRGGHMAWDLALRYSDLFAGVAPLIGAPRLAPQQGANNLRYLENLVHMPIRDLQGATDDPRAVANVQWAFERLKALKATDARLFLFPDRGHDYDFAAVDWADFFGTVRRDAAPKRVLRRAAVPGEGRAMWAEVLQLDPGILEEPKIQQPSGWGRMEEKAQRAYMATQIEAGTARLVATRTAPGRFEVTSSGVRRFRLLLTADAFVPGKSVTVVWNGKAHTRTATPSASVLLREVVERMDRTFLPVADVTVP